MVDIGQSCESSDVFRKRLDDLKAVMVAMLISAFGTLDKVRDMYDVQGLGVSPEKHGRGYGTILMRVMLATVGPLRPARLGCSLTSTRVTPKDVTPLSSPARRKSSTQS